MTEPLPEQCVAEDGSALPCTKCAACGLEIRAATPAVAGDRRPRSGDLVVCVGCGSILQYGEDLALGLVSGKTYDYLPAATRAVLLRARFEVAVLRIRRSEMN